MIHPMTDVHPSVIVPESSAVWAFAQIMMGVVIGERVSVGSGAYIGRYTRIGDGTRISTGASITDHMTIGERCFFGPHCVFMNDKHPVANNPNYKCEPPIVEDGVSVGANSTILPGVKLGAGCTVGAGAVVTKDVPPYMTVVGCPAAPIHRAADVTGAKDNV